MTEIRTLEQLQENQKELEQNIENYSTPFAFGLGLATKSTSGNILDVHYPAPQLGSDPYTCALVANAVNWEAKRAPSSLMNKQCDVLRASLNQLKNNIGYTEGIISGYTTYPRCCSKY